jgi:branched-chain amino acid transport system permease protein
LAHAETERPLAPAFEGALQRRPWAPWAAVAVVGLALLAYPFVVKDSFWANLAILALMGASAATAWNLLGGFGGQISFGHSIFFGIGAYTTGWLLLHRDLSPWLGMVLGAGLAVVAGLIIGFPVFRLRRHYFSIATIAMQQVALVLVLNSKALGSATGLELPLKPSSLVNLQFSVRDPVGYHLVALGLLAFTSLSAWLFLRGRPGAYLRAIRDDEEVARAMGVPVRRYKLFALALSAALTALTGGFFAMYALFVQPTAVISLSRSIEIVLIAVLGGAGTMWGPFVGAWMLTYLEQQTRVAFSGAGSGLDLIVYGALVMMIAILEPAGLVGLARRVARWVRRR